jgi:dTDP-4-amino-4,6-dideoxygalactose transaminase
MSAPAISPADLPAVAGGAPAKTTPFGREERYGEAELRELQEALVQGTLFYASGKKVRALEEAFARRNGVRHAVACSSGTAAIHAAMIAAGISPGDEVIVSPITDMGSVIPILFQGAVPVFADLDPRTATLSPDAVESVITPRTRAVLAVHLGGNACDLNALSALCERRGLMLIEDCAQAFGCAYEGRPIGTLGAVGCFSLNEYKHISCGDGGIVVTDDDALAVRLRLATDKAYDRRPGTAVRNPAFLAANYRMTELQGAVALAQLGKLDDIVARRRAWCAGLSERLRGLPGLLVPEPTPGCDPSWWFYLLQVAPEILGADADEVAAALRAEGMPVGAHYIGVCLYEYPVFADHSAFARGGHAYEGRDYRHGLCPNAERILDRCLILSVNEAYTPTDLDETARAFRRVHAYFCARE